jgi:hypothetical protein
LDDGSGPGDLPLKWRRKGGSSFFGAYTLGDVGVEPAGATSDSIQLGFGSFFAAHAIEDLFDARDH